MSHSEGIKALFCLVSLAVVLAIEGSIGPKIGGGIAVQTGYQYTFDDKKLVLKIVNSPSTPNHSCISRRDC